LTHTNNHQKQHTMDWNNISEAVHLNTHTNTQQTNNATYQRINLPATYHSNDFRNSLPHRSLTGISCWDDSAT